VVLRVSSAAGTSVFRKPTAASAYSWCWCVLALALTGCVTSSDNLVGQGPADTADTVERAAVAAERDARLMALDTFTVKGSLGFWDEKQNATASITWQESAEQRDILLVAPLGIGRLRVLQTGATARLEQGSDAVVTGTDAGVLLGRALGLGTPIPLQAVSEWIRGLPGKQASNVVRDQQGRLERLRWQDNFGGRWNARVLRYQTVGNEGLPALVTASSSAGNVRLALSNWEFDLSAAGPETPENRGSPSPERLGIPGR